MPVIVERGAKVRIELCTDPKSNFFNVVQSDPLAPDSRTGSFGLHWILFGVMHAICAPFDNSVGICAEMRRTEHIFSKKDVDFARRSASVSHVRTSLPAMANRIATIGDESPLKLPADLETEAKITTALVERCTELVNTYAQSKGHNELHIGGEKVCDDVGIVLQNFRMFYERTRSVSINKGRVCVPTYTSPTDLILIGAVAPFGNKWQETGALKKTRVGVAHNETKVLAKTGKTVPKWYDQFGLNVDARWERSITLIPAGVLSTMPKSDADDAEAYALLGVLSMTSFSLLQFHTRVTHFARLAFWAYGHVQGLAVDEQIEKWVESVIATEDTEQERELDDVCNEKDLIKLWKKLCSADKGPKPGLDHPSNSAFRMLPKKADARKMRADKAYSAVGSPPSVDAAHQKYADELATGAICKFAEMLKPGTKEDFVDLTPFFEKEYLRRYAHETQTSAEDCSLAKDVDPEYARALQKMRTEYINMPDHCIVTSDFVSRPQFKGESCADEAVYFTTVQKDINAGAILAIKANFSVGLRKEYTRVHSIAVLANSRFVYQLSLEDSPGPIKMTSMAVDMQHSMSLKKRKNASADPTKQLYCRRDWEVNDSDPDEIKQIPVV